MYKLWPGQAQFMTILSFDLQVWHSPFTYLNNPSTNTTTSQGEQLCEINFEIGAQIYKLGPGQAQVMTILSYGLQVWPWSSTYLNKCFQ